MAALQCDICGGKLMGRPGGIFECDSCGMQYDTAWAKAKIQEIKGTVQVEGTVEVKGTVKVDGPIKVEGKANVQSLLERGKMALEDSEWDEARECYKKVLSIKAKCAEAYLGLAMAEEETDNLEELVENGDWEGSYYCRGKKYADKATAAKIKRLEQECRDRFEKEKQEYSRVENERKNALMQRVVRSREAGNLICAGFSSVAAVTADGRVLMNCGVLPFRNVVAVSTNGYHVAVLTADGKVLDTDPDIDVSQWQDIVQISAGWDFTIGLKADGTVVAAGDNQYGQCDVSDWRNIVAISVKARHTIGLTSGGRVLAAGKCDSGACDVKDWQDIVAISTGDEHTVGLKADGTVVATKFKGNELHASSMSRDAFHLKNCVMISAGDEFTAGLTGDGKVIAVGWTWKFEDVIKKWENVVAISANDEHLAALTSGGRVLVAASDPEEYSECNNWKLFQQLDTLPQEQADGGLALQHQDEAAWIAGETKLQPIRERIRKAACLIAANKCACLSARGTVLLPETTAAGTGNGFPDSVRVWRRLVAVKIGGKRAIGLTADGKTMAEGFSDVFGWKGIVAIDLGDAHCVGLRANGTVVATGENKCGQCNVSDWQNIVAISAGGEHTVGLRADGTVVATKYLGNRNAGQCDVDFWRDIVQVSACSGYTVGLKADGTVITTVYRDYSSSSMCKVDTWREIVQVSAGGSHIVGLKADGTVVATGKNEYGQCAVGSWKNIVAIYAGYAGADYTMGLRTDGVVMIAGKGHQNQYGRVQFQLFENLDALPQEQVEGFVAQQQEDWRNVGLCQHCGGTLKGLFVKKCILCGKPKDY